MDEWMDAEWSKMEIKKIDNPFSHEIIAKFKLFRVLKLLN